MNTLLIVACAALFLIVAFGLYLNLDPGLVR